ncbi:hypothetical protein RQP46_008754 [Phenoliferia psychrophenolica]
MAPPPTALLNWFRSSYPTVLLDPEWLEACTDYLMTHFPTTTPQQLIKKVEYQLLLSDLSTSILPSPRLLPSPLPAHPTTLFPTRPDRVLVQITSIDEIAHPALGLLDTLKEKRESRRIAALGRERKDGEEEDNPGKYARGLVRVTLSDGYTTCEGFEYQRIEGLGLEEVKLGCKLLLHSVRVVKGMLLLSPESVTIKGENIEEMEESAELKLELRLRARLGTTSTDLVLQNLQQLHQRPLLASNPTSRSRTTTKKPRCATTRLLLPLLAAATPLQSHSQLLVVLLLHLLHPPLVPLQNLEPHLRHQNLEPLLLHPRQTSGSGVSAFQTGKGGNYGAPPAVVPPKNAEAGPAPRARKPTPPPPLPKPKPIPIPKPPPPPRRVSPSSESSFSFLDESMDADALAALDSLEQDHRHLSLAPPTPPSRPLPKPSLPPPLPSPSSDDEDQKPPPPSRRAPPWEASSPPPPNANAKSSANEKKPQKRPVEVLEIGSSSEADMEPAPAPKPKPKPKKVVGAKPKASSAAQGNKKKEERVIVIDD